MKRILLLILIIISCTDSAKSVQDNASLKAYYTRLPYDDKNYTGKYADILIEIPSIGNLIFSRENGYSPFWKPLNAKGYFIDNNIENYVYDKHNISSNVAIVERTDSRVVVHWRYSMALNSESFNDYKSAYNRLGTPAPFFAEYVDEYFIIYKTGKLERIVKRGCYKLDEWEDPANKYYQEIKLSDKGADVISETFPSKSTVKKDTVNHVIKASPFIEDAVMAFRFDEALDGSEDYTKELKSNRNCYIEGVKSYWDKGISGSCLNYDSYSSSVVLPSNNVHCIETGNLTISAWISPLEYPFNTAAIIDHLSGKTGYFLGLNRLGQLELKFGDGKELYWVKSSVVPLYSWTYVVAHIDSQNHIADIYINGVFDKAEKFQSFKDEKGVDLVIGKTKSFGQYPLGAERKVTKGFKSQMVFSGLIDELLVFDKIISDVDLINIYKMQKPQSVNRLRQYILPDSPLKNKFDATYMNLKYHKYWDGLWRVGKYSDLVVTFKNKPWRYVFWRGTRYLPSLVTDYGRSGIWSSDQGPEIFPGQCYEHMSDMLCRFSNIRLIHKSPARIVVHWRNASVNIEYKWPKLNNDGWGVWTDEYWTIYPDGTSIRHQLTHNSEGLRVIEMNQNEILHHPGQKTEDLLYDDAVYTGNQFGDIKCHKRLGATKGNREEMNLLYTNLNSSTKQFQIGEIGTKIDIHLYDDLWWNGWDHYPCQLIPSDGTVAFTYDRGGSSCPSTFREVRRKIDDVTTEAMQIYGLTDKTPSELLQLNRFWNFSPQISSIEGADYIGFIKSEKAYYFRQKDSNKMSFKINGTETQPIDNPVFVIKGFKGKLENTNILINDRIVSLEKGIELDEEGKENLVVWIPYSSVGETDVVINF